MIAFAWQIQLLFFFKGKNDIRPEFIIICTVEVLMLMIQDTIICLTLRSYLEMGKLAAAVLVLIKRLRTSAV